MKQVLALVCAALIASVSIANAAHRHRHYGHYGHYGYRGGGTAAAAHFQNQFNKNTY